MINGLAALLPVVLFLAALVLMDSFKLVRPAVVIGAVGWGMLAALLAMGSTELLPDPHRVSPAGFARYIGPVIEETLKGVFVMVLIARARVGFLVDAAILGFAVGTGFALVENLVYLRVFGGGSAVLLWFVRGFGTAILHGAATAIFATLAKRAADLRPERLAWAWLPGWVAAVSIHSAFNLMLLPPVAGTALLLAILPMVVVVVFHLSERSTREWVGAGLDLDVALLHLVESDEFKSTRFCAYLQRLRSSFPGRIVADMFCLLRVELELSARAKATLLARQAGVQLAGDEDLIAALAEREYLERSIGTTGLLALKPLRVTSDRDAWHRHLLHAAFGSAGRRNLPRPPKP
jgi:RsiW-degrading membrane proteinase PrsW (M82 family)